MIDRFHHLAKVLDSTFRKRPDNDGGGYSTCSAKLIQGRYTWRTIKTISGPIRFKRWRGYCPPCKGWFCPADEELKLNQGNSPLVEEIIALFSREMSIAEECNVMLRATGAQMPPSTLNREAKRVGRNAQQKLDQMNEDSTATTEDKRPIRTPIIEIEAWNLRGRDQWGQSQALRDKEQKPSRWQWVWGTPIFVWISAVEQNWCGQDAQYLFCLGIFSRYDSWNQLFAHLDSADLDED